MAIVCPRCGAPATLSAELAHSAGRARRCSRCHTTWFVRMHPTDRLAKGRGDSPSLAAYRSDRPRFERIIEHDGGDNPAESRCDRTPPSAVGGHAIVGHRWLGAVAAAVVCGLVAMFALHSVVAASPVEIGAVEQGGVVVGMH